MGDQAGGHGHEQEFAVHLHPLVATRCCVQPRIVAVIHHHMALRAVFARQVVAALPARAVSAVLHLPMDDAPPLFRTGVARSGAYNRTLTPFGFQAEQRTYWEAGDTYDQMSPFTFANRVNEPILLIHGEADDNSGTFPVQSERFYAALKGLGATARYVTLPLEAHGYRARESVGHTLWEMTRWLDQYVKNAGPRAAPAAD